MCCLKMNIFSNIFTIIPIIIAIRFIHCDIISESIPMRSRFVFYSKTSKATDK